MSYFASLLLWDCYTPVLMSYAIEVRKAPVRIQGVRGDGFAAEVFLHSARPHDPGVETVSDRLNSTEEQFLPCQTETGVSLIRLDAIAYLECLDPRRELAWMDEVGASKVSVEMTLGTGEHLTGELLCQLPEGRRVSDYLNTDESRFLLLIEDSRVLFINKNAIDRITE